MSALHGGRCFPIVPKSLAENRDFDEPKVDLFIFQFRSHEVERSVFELKRDASV